MQLINRKLNKYGGLIPRWVLTRYGLEDLGPTYFDLGVYAKSYKDARAVLAFVDRPIPELCEMKLEPTDFRRIELMQPSRLN